MGRAKKSRSSKKESGKKPNIQSNLSEPEIDGAPGQRLTELRGLASEQHDIAISSPEDVKTLAQLLGDEKAGNWAAYTLSKAADNPALSQELYSTLRFYANSDDEKVASDACGALLFITENDRHVDAAADILIDVLKNGKMVAQEAASLTLAGLSGYMIDQLIPPPPGLVHSSLANLSKSKDVALKAKLKENAQVLADSLGHESENVRLNSAMTLTNIDQQLSRSEAKRVLLEALQSEDEYVRYRAVRFWNGLAEAKFDISVAIPPLTALLRDKGMYSTISNEASQAISRACRNGEDLSGGIETIVLALEDNEIYLNLHKILTDALINPSSRELTTSLLFDNLSSGQSEIRSKSAAILASASGMLDLPPHHPIWALSLVDSDPAVRSKISRTLIRSNFRINDVRALGTRHTAVYMIFVNSRKAIDSANPNVRKNAAHAIIKNLKHEDRIIRGSAAQAILDIGIACTRNIEILEDIKMPIIEALEDEFPEIRFCAAFAISTFTSVNFRMDEAVKPLAKLLMDEPDPRVRSRVSYALRDIAKEGDVADAISALGNSLNDPDDDIRRNCIVGLENALRNGHSINSVLDKIAMATDDNYENVRLAATAIMENLKGFDA